MPHAESEKSSVTTTMEQPITNGEKPYSQFVAHLTSYPLISDSISTYKTNPYGAKTISIFHSAYSTAYSNIYAPFSPYLKTPYSMVAPYLQKADSLGDSGLSSLESRFPIVKEPTASIQDKVVGVAGLPLKYAKDGKEYVFKTYGDEYEKSQGNGIVKQAKAIVGTEIRVTGDMIKGIADFLGKVKSQGQQYVSEKKQQVDQATE